MTETSFESFFNRLKHILETEKIQLEEKRSRGELFNIFEVLGMTTSEVRTHSALIAELLRPDGTHGLSNLPLSSFVSLINKQIVRYDFDTHSAKVYLEYDVGRIDESCENGGRLDILVESLDGKKAILIENKINADDQYKQLLRYYHFAKNRYDDFILLYLNKERLIASDHSTDGKLTGGKDYYSISYRDEIQAWIKDCLALSYDKPIIRETLIQYLSLISNLTNTMEISNEQIIQEMMKYPEETARILHMGPTYYQKVIDTLLKKQFEEFADKNQLELNIDDGFLTGKHHTRLTLRRKNWKNAVIVIAPDNNKNNYFIGVVHKDTGKELQTKWKTLSMMTDGTNDVYPFGSKWLPESYRYFYNADTIRDIIKGEFINVVGNLVKDILEELDSIEGFEDL